MWNFVHNSAWTFRQRDSSPWPSRLVRFHLVTLAAGAVNYSILVLLVRGLGIPDLLANLVGIAAGALVNYSANSLWTWRQIPVEGDEN